MYMVKNKIKFQQNHFRSQTKFLSILEYLPNLSLYIYDQWKY